MEDEIFEQLPASMRPPQKTGENSNLDHKKIIAEMLQ